MARVYVVAAFQSAPEVRILHTRLRLAGHDYTSSWAETAHGPEDLTALSTAECRAIWSQNDADMRRADAVWILADTPCREGWMEAQRAVDMGGMPIVVVGRPTLTLRAWCDGVTYVPGVDAALATLGPVTMREVQP